MINQGHIKMAVGGTTYPFVVDPLSYQEVDIIDFAPRAVGADVSLSELGLYTDAGQDDFGHGFGKWEYDEPQSYAYSGHLVDTRHGFIQLFYNPTAISGTQTSTTIRKMLIHRGYPVILYPDRLAVVNSSGNSEYSGGATMFGSDTADSMITTQKYIIVSNDGRLRICDVGKATSGGSTTITMTGAGWDTNAFDGSGEVYIIGGTGSGQNQTVVSNTSDTITVDTSWTTNPDSTSIFVVVANTGVDANPPNGFGKMAAYGGYYWGIEADTNFLHWWANENGSDAEGSGLTDAGVVQVGPYGTPLVRLQAFDNQLFAFREDGAWTVHEDNLAYQSGIMFEDQTSSINFAATLVWQGFLIFPVRNRVYKFKTGLQDITPPQWSDEIPYKHFGNYSHMVVRGKHMYIMGKSSHTNTDETLEDNAGFVVIMAHDGVGWHKLVDFPDNAAAPTDYGMWLDEDNDRMYFYACVSGNPKLYYFKFEELSDFPYATYPTSSYCNWYSSYYDFNLPRINKSYSSLTIGGDFPANTKVTANYRIDDASAWTSLGDFTSDMQSISFPSSTTGQKIQIRLRLYTTTSGSTPVVKKVILKLMLRPDVLYGVNCDILVADSTSDPNRLSAGLTSKEIRTALKAARSSTAPISFTDLYGDSADAYLSSVRFVTIAYEGMDRVQTIARCTIVYV